MGQLQHECGVAAVYQFDAAAAPNDDKNGAEKNGATRRAIDCGAVVGNRDSFQATQLTVRMLQDIQNRGQLSAGITSFDPDRQMRLDTHKEIGTVAEVFHMSQGPRFKRLVKKYEGRAAIGHVRYATCGKDDRSYAQPFERQHLQRGKWFSFCFNGQLANYRELAEQITQETDHYLARETDTEVLLHLISEQFSRHPENSFGDMMSNLAARLDGAYSIALLNSYGHLMVARDPLGIKPMCFAKNDSLFAAASESVALRNLGFENDRIETLKPGEIITIRNNELKKEFFTEERGRAHCFFEWIYFANVASSLDDKSVYLSRTKLGTELGMLERSDPLFQVDDDTIVVPVPDTSKASADAMAFELKIPSREGLIRNRYSGRTFIETSQSRRIEKARSKYTPLRDVMEGKKILLVEDSIVRSTTMRVLLDRIRTEGRAAQIHVRVACPPIVGPCFYGINIPTKSELFATKFLQTGQKLTPDIEAAMARELGCDSLRYLPIDSVARGIGFEQNELCQACLTGTYPTACGQQNFDAKYALTNIS